MAKTLRLTWDKRGKRWKKKINGVQEYFGQGQSKGDRASYDKALAVLTLRLQELDSLAKTEEEKWRPIHPSQWGMSMEQMRRAVARFDGVAHQPKRVKTIGETIGVFAHMIKAQVKAKQLKPSTGQGYGAHGGHLPGTS